VTGGGQRAELPRVRAERLLREMLGGMHAGDRLPSAAKLSREFGVSQGTVGGVLKKLSNEDVITVLRYYGTFKTLFVLRT
jgi:DNA-binding FadR family transcriptional regulator